jgi:hypothetical protein
MMGKQTSLTGFIKVFSKSIAKSLFAWSSLKGALNWEQVVTHTGSNGSALVQLGNSQQHGH